MSRMGLATERWVVGVARAHGRTRADSPWESAITSFPGVRKRLRIADSLPTEGPERSEYLPVTPWERMPVLLEQIGKRDLDVIDGDLGFGLCPMKREGVDAIVLVSL